MPGEDDKHHVSAGSFVTMKVKLTRSTLLGDEAVKEAMAVRQADTVGMKQLTNSSAARQSVAADQTPTDGAEQEEAAKESATKRKPWEKPQKAKKKSNKGGGTSQNKTSVGVAMQRQMERAKRESLAAKEATTTPNKEGAKEGGNNNNESDAEQQSDAASCSADEETSKDAKEAMKEAATAKDEETTKEDEDGSGGDDSEPEELDDRLFKHDLALETKSKVTHLVHAPFYPDDKYEWWWLYLVDKNRDKKLRALVTAPQQVCTLVHEETHELRFQVGEGLRRGSDGGLFAGAREEGHVHVLGGAAVGLVRRWGDGEGGEGGWEMIGNPFFSLTCTRRSWPACRRTTTPDWTRSRRRTRTTRDRSRRRRSGRSRPMRWAGI